MTRTSISAQKRFVFALLGCCVGALANAAPVIVPDPAPGAFGPDIGGTGLFSPDPLLISLEVLDTGASLGFGGAEFGMFYSSAPGTLIPIFQTTDQDPDPGGPGSITQSAIVDLTSGQVTDGDEGVLQNTFTPGTGQVGFYLKLSDILASVFGVSPIFTDPTLNLGGEDMSATFPVLDPSVQKAYLLGFGAIDPNDVSQTTTTLGYYAVIGLTVPEPATLLLLVPMIGMILGAGTRGRR